MGINPLLPVSLAIDSYMPGLRSQDKNGRADVTALLLKRIANFNSLQQPPSGEQFQREKVPDTISTFSPSID